MTGPGARPNGAARVDDMVVDRRRGRRNAHHRLREEDHA
jgi:hypothetical protein